MEKNKDQFSLKDRTITDKDGEGKLYAKNYSTNPESDKKISQSSGGEGSFSGKAGNTLSSDMVKKISRSASSHTKYKMDDYGSTGKRNHKN